MLSKADFAKQVYQALQNLHDFAYLQKLDLTAALCGPDRMPGRSVRLLRTELLDAIERLNPREDLPPRARERRPYAVLYGRYVQGLSTPELVEELAISVRQLRREHKRAVGAIAELMWGRLSEHLSAEPAVATSGPVSPSMERQKTAGIEAEQLIGQAQAESLAIRGVVQGVLAVLEPVARKRGIRVQNLLPDGLPPARADRIVLRQALLELLSYAMDYTQAQEIAISSVLGEPSSLAISATGQGKGQAPTSEVRLDVSRKLIAGLGGRVTISEQPERWQARIDLPVPEDVPILVMDDNEGLVELFRRYLGAKRYRVLPALTAAEAIQQAREASPRLIILDVMMPGQDGWEILQQLRAAPETKDTPIMICSVLDEPEIAASLGASDYLTKPVSQDALITKVEHWCDSSA